MVHATIQHQLLAQLEQLPVDLQRRVLDFARALAATSSPRGTPGRDLLSLAGTLPEESATEIADAIEDGCERVDHGEW